MLANLPRSWSAALEQLRRDVAVVTRRLGGESAPPVVARSAAARSRSSHAEPAKARVDAGARVLEIARVVRETEDAATLVLRDPNGAPFDFLPGQFFTLLTDQRGETVPRNYSASNAPGSDELHLTIKRKAGGRVSGALVGARAGETMRVLGPFGAFVVAPEAGARRRLVLVAGGAGITPLASIARAVLRAEPHSEIVLVYGNRREEDVIFAAELGRLAAQHRHRFRVVHVLEDAASARAAHVGRLDGTTAARVFDALPLASAPDTRFYVCGPDPMRDEVVRALSARGVPSERIKVERFTIGPRPEVASSPADGALGEPGRARKSASAPGTRPIAIRIGKDVRHATVLPGATLLDAGLAAGAPMPFSCAAGGCGACRVRVLEGEVEVEEPNCLSDAERAAGYVLTCVGRPRGACTIEVPETGGGG